MCGISGFYDPTIGADQAGKVLHNMLESIAHRGPDARGTYFNKALALGHNRLSIIDLSEEGNQPMEYFDSVITYNGEIYNYLEVRADLIKKGYVFKTQSDTEVILASYREYGTRCVDYFVGMWAFALWDKKKEILFCSRDRFGIKPFYYIHQGDKFYFGSEYKALKQSPIFSNDLNLNQVSRGLQMGWVTYDDETYYSTLKQLPAAHNLIYSNGKVNSSLYWDLDLTKKFVGTFEEKKQKFFELFSDSIQLHMRSDVEVGGCLSGGLDSSAITASISSHFKDLRFKTFNIFYTGKNEVDERKWVNEVTSKYTNIDPYFFSPTDNDISENFEKALFYSDVPVTGSSPFSQYFVMQLAAKNKVKVILDGQGSDEYLAGYMHSFYRILGSMIGSFQFSAFSQTLSGLKEEQEYSSSKLLDIVLKSGMCTLFSEQKLYALEYKNYFPFLAAENKGVPFSLTRNGGSALSEFLYHLTFNTSLPTLLHFEDRNSMAFSIESRVPFLDHRLVEFSFSLLDSDKIHKSSTKYILREALGQILPEAIKNRKDKKGFVTPGETNWLRGCQSYLLDDDFNRLSFLNATKTNKVLKDFKLGDNRNANLVWRLAVLNHWLK